MQILSANIGVQIKPVFHFQTREIGQIIALKSECAQKSTVNKTPIGFRIGFWIGLRMGSDFGSDRIGLRIGLVPAELLFLRKSCFNNDTGGSDFFSFEPPVSLIRKIVFHVSPALKFTISLKIIAKNYFHLKCTEKFSVA